MFFYSENTVSKINDGDRLQSLKPVLNKRPALWLLSRSRINMNLPTMIDFFDIIQRYELLQLIKTLSTL
jgi:hypothetical protein